MGYNAPCLKCEMGRKGCGAYHDACEKYIEYKKLKEKEYSFRIEKLNLCEDVKNGINRAKRRR